MSEAAKKAFETALGTGTRTREQEAADAAKREAEKYKEAARRAKEHREAMNKSSGVIAETRKELGGLWGGAEAKKRSRRVTAKRFCSCVKKVKASKKPKTEGSSIAICTSSLLWPHGRTLHSVTCRRKASIKTQKRSTAMRKK
jgi:hypothetical protein